MKVLEIALQVAQMLGKEDLVTFLQDGTSVDITSAKKERQKVVDCVHAVSVELAGGLCKLKCEEKFTPQDKRVFFKDFSNKILSINQVTNLKGEKVFYKLFPTYIALYDDKPINVCYNYLPNKISLEDEIVVGSTLITSAVFCYGVVAEYYLISSLYEEAVFWRKKFEESLSRVMMVKNYKIKGRAFV